MNQGELELGGLGISVLQPLTGISWDQNPDVLTLIFPFLFLPSGFSQRGLSYSLKIYSVSDVFSMSKRGTSLFLPSAIFYSK